MKTSLLWGAVVLAAGLAPRPAFAEREFARGNIKAVDWNVMQININGNTYKVARDCEVKFTDCPECFPNPTLKDLQPPMYVHFVYEPEPGNDTVVRMDVKEIGGAPRRVRPGESASAAPLPGGASSQTLKVKIVRLDERSGAFHADVAGRQQSFRAANRSDLREFREGDLAVITVERRGTENLVTSMQAAGRSGTVTMIDEKRGEIGLEVNGRERVYRVESNRMLSRVKVGDRVTFDVENRSGREVLTTLDR